MNVKKLMIAAVIAAVTGTTAVAQSVAKDQSPEAVVAAVSVMLAAAGLAGDGYVSPNCGMGACGKAPPANMGNGSPGTNKKPPTHCLNGGVRNSNGTCVDVDPATGSGANDLGLGDTVGTAILTSLEIPSGTF